MAVDAIAGAAAATQSKTQVSESKLAENFDTFMTLLTTQMKNQDPLNPMDSAQFTEQLVQFSQVEQAIASNKNLETLIASSNASQTATAVGYLGTSVVAEGYINGLQDGQATWEYEFDGTAKSVSAVVTTESGKVVYATTLPTDPGRNEFNWDGKDNSGKQLGDGNYKISVSAVNFDNESLNVRTYVKGTISAIANDGAGPLLMIGKAPVEFNKVERIEEKPATTTVN